MTAATHTSLMDGRRRSEDEIGGDLGNILEIILSKQPTMPLLIFALSAPGQSALDLKASSKTRKISTAISLGLVHAMVGEVTTNGRPYYVPH